MSTKIRGASQGQPSGEHVRFQTGAADLAPQPASGVRDPYARRSLAIKSRTKARLRRMSFSTEPEGEEVSRSAKPS